METEQGVEFCVVKDKTACGINEFGNDPDGPISEDEYDETYHVPETLAPLDYHHLNLFLS